MKVFDAYDSAVKRNGINAPKAKQLPQGAKAQSKEKSEVKEKAVAKPSREEILTKVENKKAEKSEKSKEETKVSGEEEVVSISKKAKVIKDNQKEKTENAPEEVKKSDVGLNDPSDPTTKVKLKEALSNGAINFNPNERKVIEQILTQET